MKGSKVQKKFTKKYIQYTYNLSFISEFSVVCKNRIERSSHISMRSPNWHAKMEIGPKMKLTLLPALS